MLKVLVDGVLDRLYHCSCLFFHSVENPTITLQEVHEALRNTSADLTIYRSTLEANRIDTKLHILIITRSESTKMAKLNS